MKKIVFVSSRALNVFSMGPKPQKMVSVIANKSIWQIPRVAFFKHNLKDQDVIFLGVFGLGEKMVIIERTTSPNGFFYPQRTSNVLQNWTLSNFGQVLDEWLWEWLLIMSLRWLRFESCSYTRQIYISNIEWCHFRVYSNNNSDPIFWR